MRILKLIDKFVSFVKDTGIGISPQKRDVIFKQLIRRKLTKKQPVMPAVMFLSSSPSTKMNFTKSWPVIVRMYRHSPC